MKTPRNDAGSTVSNRCRHSTGRGLRGNRDRQADFPQGPPERVPFFQMGSVPVVASPRMWDLGHGNGQEFGTMILWRRCMSGHAV
ncbi:MAG: hypothetical protein OXC57_10370 [Rhodobacteraceae bacterium]|nr:hypothetical protein [Paracoccaceae bacterium]